MAKVIVSLNHAVLVSEVKLADYAKLAHYRPDSLKLIDEEKKEPVFAVKVGWEEDADISKYGIIFGSQTRGEGKAAIEIPVPSIAEDPAKFIQVQYGTAIMALNKLEEKLPAVLAEIDAEIAEVKSHIEIADLDGDGAEVAAPEPEAEG